VADVTAPAAFLWSCLHMMTKKL